MTLHWTLFVSNLAYVDDVFILINIDTLLYVAVFIGDYVVIFGHYKHESTSLLGIIVLIIPVLIINFINVAFDI